MYPNGRPSPPLLQGSNTPPCYCVLLDGCHVMMQGGWRRWINGERRFSPHSLQEYSWSWVIRTVSSFRCRTRIEDFAFWLTDCLPRPVLELLHFQHWEWIEMPRYRCGFLDCHMDGLVPWPRQAEEYFLHEEVIQSSFLNFNPQ